MVVPPDFDKSDAAFSPGCGDKSCKTKSLLGICQFQNHAQARCRPYRSDKAKFWYESDDLLIHPHDFGRSVQECASRLTRVRDMVTRGVMTVGIVEGNASAGIGGGGISGRWSDAVQTDHRSLERAGR
jgi:hypothetical protein